MSAEVGWTILAAIVMIVGLAGVVVPVLPGLMLLWGTALAYGFAVGFETIGLVVMGILSVILAVSIIKGIVLPRREAVASGASTMAQLGGLVGAIAGFFLIPVVGVFVGGLVGILAVEYLNKGNWDDAWRSTKGLAKGLGINVLVDLVLGLTMIGVWSVWAATVVF